MNQFYTLFCFGLKRRSKDFFVLFYSIIFPIIITLLLGYLTSTSYGTSFTSYHYYTITMIPFCNLMGITTVSYAAQDEKLLHTAYRYIIAPINVRELVLSKFASCSIVLSMCNCVTLLIAVFLFRLSFHFNILILILLLSCETICVTGIGLYLGLACKNLDLLRNSLNIPIIIFGFLGGSFFPVSSFNPILSFFINLSPLTWVNHGIIAYIYSDKLQILEIISVLFLSIGLIMASLTIHHFKKEAFI